MGVLIVSIHSSCETKQLCANRDFDPIIIIIIHVNFRPQSIEHQKLNNMLKHTKKRLEENYRK